MRYVRLRVQTNWDGNRLRPGDELYVPEAVAIRWERNRIADILDSEPSQPDPPPAVDVPPVEDGSTESEDDEPAGDESDVPAAKPVYTVERVGTSSWHDLLRDGEVIERLNGEGNAWARARELSGAE